VGRPHGVSGEVRLRLPAGPSENLAEGMEVRLVPKDSEESPRVTRLLSLRGDPAAPIAQFEGVSGRDEAAALVHSILEIPAAALPKPGPGEFYHHEVLGAELVDLNGESLGEVTGVTQGGGRGYLVCQTGRGEAYLPLVKDALLEIDRGSKRVVANPKMLLVPGEIGEE